MSLWDRFYAMLPEWWQSSMSNSVNILITGKTGAGKTSLINGIVGSEVAEEGHSLKRGTTEVTPYELEYQGVSITVWDSPGLQDGLENEEEYLKDMRAKCAKVDLVLYCTKMNDTRMGNDDKKAIKKLTQGLGKEFWKNAVFVLTFGNEVKPPPRRGGEEPSAASMKEYFSNRIEDWSKELRAVVQDAGVDPRVVQLIPILPAGYDSVIGLPDRSNWLSPLWYASITRMKDNAQPALLKANIDRIKLPDEVKPEDFNKPLHEQPLIIPPLAKFGAPPPIMAIIGAVVGGAVGGPPGAVAGGAAGVGFGAAVDGVIAYFDL